MPYTSCPACQFDFHYPPALSGLVVDCPKCRHEFRDGGVENPRAGLGAFVGRAALLAGLLTLTVALIVVMATGSRGASPATGAKEPPAKVTVARGSATLPVHRVEPAPAEPQLIEFPTPQRPAAPRADEPPPLRKDLVTAIRKKVGLDPADYDAKTKELADTLKSAKAGRINPALDTKVRRPKTLGTDPFTFRSVKIRDEFVAESEAAVESHKTLAEDTAKDIRKHVGLMGRPGTDAVGHLSSGAKTNVVERVIDARTMSILVPYTVVVVGFDRKPIPETRQERLILVGIPTAKYAERRGYDFEDVYYVGGAVDYGGERVLSASPVTLSDAERLLLAGR